jgi:predicted DNA-binding transcriptional regulator AlpA
MQIPINTARKIPVAEAAAFLGVSKSWLDKHRVHGGGPAYLKIGRRVVYDLNDLEEFAAGRRFRNTSDPGLPLPDSSSPLKAPLTEKR